MFETGQKRPVASTASTRSASFQLTGADDDPKAGAADRAHAFGDPEGRARVGADLGGRVTYAGEAVRERHRQLAARAQVAAPDDSGAALSSFLARTGPTTSSAFSTSTPITTTATGRTGRATFARPQLTGPRLHAIDGVATSVRRRDRLGGLIHEYSVAA